MYYFNNDNNISAAANIKNKPQEKKTRIVICQLFSLFDLYYSLYNHCLYFPVIFHTFFY